MQVESFQVFVNDLRKHVLDQPSDKQASITQSILQKYADKLDEWILDSFFLIENEEGFLAHVLHEEDDHRLCVMATAWLPGKGAPPHNHATWAVVTGLYGEEVNTLWNINGDLMSPKVAIERKELVTCARGEYLTLGPDDVHSVCNNGDEVSVSLQIYGHHPNHTNRVQVNAATGKVTPFICAETVD